jgi:hypothetical protein
LRLKTSSNTEEPVDIALKYIVFLASDEDRLSTFCNLSGIGEAELKERLINPEFQAFLLDFLLQNETDLLAFAAENNLKPEAIMRGRSKLPGFSHDL